jgi:hypothetical protein
MKTTFTLIVNVFIFAALILLLTEPYFNQPASSAQAVSQVAPALQTTPTPQVDEVSVIGSTDGILVMGIVIVLIVTLPHLFRKKKK